MLSLFLVLRVLVMEKFEVQEDGLGDSDGSESDLKENE